MLQDELDDKDAASHRTALWTTTSTETATPSTNHMDRHERKIEHRSKQQWLRRLALLRARRQREHGSFDSFCNDQFSVTTERVWKRAGTSGTSNHAFDHEVERKDHSVRDYPEPEIDYEYRFYFPDHMYEEDRNAKQEKNTQSSFKEGVGLVSFDKDEYVQFDVASGSEECQDKRHDSSFVSQDPNDDSSMDSTDVLLNELLSENTRVLGACYPHPGAMQPRRLTPRTTKSCSHVQSHSQTCHPASLIERVWIKYDDPSFDELSVASNHGEDDKWNVGWSFSNDNSIVSFSSMLGQGIYKHTSAISSWSCNLLPSLCASEPLDDVPYDERFHS